MKKLIVLLIAVSMLVTFASCKKEAEKENSESASPEVTEATKGDSEAADTTATDTTAADTTAADTTAADTTTADTTTADTTAADTTAADTTAADTTAADTTAAETPEQEEGYAGPDDFIVSDADAYIIDTPYCKLCYPIKWKDVVVVEKAEEGSSYKVDFYANLDSGKIPLYSVVFRGEGTGFVAGEIETEDGIINVFFEDHTGNKVENLSENDKETYLSMCEDINVIISNLIDDYAMELY